MEEIQTTGQSELTSLYRKHIYIPIQINWYKGEIYFSL